MPHKIVKNKDYLHKPTTPVSTVEEGEEIANKLIEVLGEIKHALGISANQIGIPKSVSVVKVRADSKPLVLINPTIIDSGKETIAYLEGCLSLPGKRATTVRKLVVTVNTLNHANPLTFGPDIEPVTKESVGNDYGILESVCVQHEIDHLNGRLMTDPEVRYVPPKPVVVKHGRNDKVVVEKDGETQYLKYKKAVELVEQGWKII